MPARNRASTIKIILVLFYETSLHTQRKFFIQSLMSYYNGNIRVMSHKNAPGSKLW